MKITDVCIGVPEPVATKSGVTGHFKKPVAGPVAVTTLGLAGDHIIDLKNHGGVDQAVYLFGAHDQAYWAQVYQKPLMAGFFGENLLVSDLASESLCIGDVLTIGATVLQVTSTRIPCATYQAHIGTKTAMAVFMRAAKAGAYARVLTEGPVCAGDTVQITPWDGPRITMADAMWHYVDGFKDHGFLEQTLKVPAHHKMHEIARDRLAR